MGFPYDENKLFQYKFPPQVWNNVTTFIRNLRKLPIWSTRETASHFVGKQNIDYWKAIFETGKSPTGQQVLVAPINYIEMIKEYFSCPIHRKTFKPINKYLPTFKNYKSDERIKLLGYQIVASEMIKKQYSIVLFNDTYDLLITDKNKLILLSIDVSVDNKTINSISPVNGVNFDNKIKEFLVKFDLNNINCFRIDFVTIRFLKSGPKIDIKKGKLYEY